MIRNQLSECHRLGVTIQYGVEVGPGVVDERRPDEVIVAMGAEPARPWWVPDDADRVADVREVLDGSAAGGGPQPGQSVVVIDELGFHHATSVAELLADRGCAVEVVTNGMVVGQDLGITLDMELWWMRAEAKGIVQSTDLVPMGLADGELTLLHHPTGQHQTRRPDWVVLAVPPNPVEWLYHDLKAAGVSVQRVGDCIAPRRAHAAVVDGERAGATV
jgi:2,4-dienoyl-CoA reductase (NADPH2)